MCCKKEGLYGWEPVVLRIPKGSSDVKSKAGFAAVKRLGRLTSFSVTLGKSLHLFGRDPQSTSVAQSELILFLQATFSLVMNLPGQGASPAQYKVPGTLGL